MNKVLIIGDIHIGNNKNNKIFYDITLKYAEWIKSICNDNGIKTIIQMGDIFHDRTAINLQSIQYGYEFFKILEEFNIHIIAGNHDLFYNNDCSVSSICILDRWPNITVYTKPTVVDEFVFLPWGTKLEDMPKGKIGIAHLEMAGHEMSRNKICEHGLKGADVMEKYDLLFSGHFHKHQGRIYNGKRFIYTGSAFQLNWGESGNKNYVFIVDPSTCEIQQIENIISPKFEYIESEKDEHKISGNFISFKVKSKEDGLKLKEKYESHNPLFINTQVIPFSETITPTDKQLQLIKVEDAIEEYVKQMTDYTEEERKIILEEGLLLYKNIS